MAQIRIVLAVIATLLALPVLAAIGLLAVPFWLTSFMTRKFSGAFETTVVPWEHLMEFNPTLGWKPRSNLDVHYLTRVKDGVFHVVTDERGWPDRLKISRSDIVVFGDSYAFGYGVDAAAAFWNRSDGIAIKSIGAPGYNMVQELLLMRQLSSELRHKLIIWFVYYGNDLYENLVPNMDHYRMPFLRKENGSSEWRIETSHVSVARWPNSRERDYYDRLAEICCRSPLSERAFSACHFLFTEAQRICNEVDAKLLVMTIPDVVQLSSAGVQRLAKSAPDPKSFDPHLPDKKIREMAYELKIPVVALREHLRREHYKERDPHWNERGHQRVAELIALVWNETYSGSPCLSGELPLSNGNWPRPVSSSF